MNDVALCANEVLRNDVMLRINEVALRANEHASSVYSLFLNNQAAVIQKDYFQTQK